MSRAKRKRQKERRAARRDAAMPTPELSAAELDALLVDITVRVDCEHAATRTTPGGVVLTRCAVGASVAGGCPRDCERFERRRVGGLGL